ncbi:sec-independent translocase [Streptomyces zingiberis]|uniref:Sec-independent protein translocase protein TatB n=1 Tax=Streptomyces zingiberis TaxID=2053010 RepID=A0ABX1BTF4_9ACTN|nr:sec-independent translocase [Streptomyces zingiberis]NJQ00981.1 Sec-independent protein translocase subunit TatB [Streptomyces zingiberis]
MFNDIGALELVTLVILAVLIFGPDKLPKVIQDVSAFIRKIRDFSENAKADIRNELGPEFKDFEFEDLNPKTFVRKQLLENDDLGVKELRSSFDLRKEMNEVADAVNGRDSGSDGGSPLTGSGSRVSFDKTPDGAGGGSDPLRKPDRLAPGERPPYDVDAT